MTDNKFVINWVKEMAELLRPEKITWINGSEEQLEILRKKACENNELIKLNQEKLPGCYLHRTDINDVARVEDRTFICTSKEKDAGPTNNWKNPAEMHEILNNIIKNSYKNKTMYIIPYCMGPVNSEFSKFGIEITDSIYVVLNMAIMTRVNKNILNKLNENNWVKGLHCTCNLNKENRYICHFPEENKIISVNSCYGGNVLLGKKCFALRIASFMGKKENWLAEHMLILGIQSSEKEEDIKYIAAAFPSACGKTNLAMLIPPEIYKNKKYKIWCVGDDIAWMRIGKDGRLWAINPENGFFGVAPGTSKKSNLNALISASKNTIFTNVVQDLKNNTVWWEGLDKNPPENALNWKGEVWNGKISKEKGAHPNSRFAAPAENCPCISKKFNSPEGVPISAIIFGGRRAKNIPLVLESKDWNHGVFLGSVMASETTAAATGQTGITRRDPMAMLPFCGYNMNEYFAHWINIGKKLKDKAPKIFNVNWFRVDKDNKFIWPGFGENLRVLEWILKRCENKINARETEIGFLPYIQDININNLNISEKDLKEIFKIDKNSWKEEIKDIENFYKKFENLPEELKENLNTLKSNFL